MSKNINIILLLLFFILFFNFVFSQDNLNSFLFSEKEEMLQISRNQNETQIDNAIYIIRNNNGEKNLDIEGNVPTFLNNPKKPLKKHFRFISIDKNTKKPSNIINSDDYFCIEDKDNHRRIGVLNQDGQIGLYQAKDSNSDITDNYLWKIFLKIIEEKINNKINKNVYYYIQNKFNGKYLSYVEANNNKGTLKCNVQSIDKLNKNNYFLLHKMYREKSPNESLEILDKEPIDVLIKYIDLSDPNLKREGIAQIKKDEDNGELKYAVRSILKNIPWIRKIFILMPNEKVRFFKEPEEIKDKIVYVKDKDLLGFDSASSPAFQFNLWRMKEFGMSENFILMDDDCFIGKPLLKSNFFYEENGEVFPASITGDYYELNKQTLNTALKPLLAKISSINSHQPNGFNIMQKSTLLFLYDIFGDDDTRFGNPLIEAAFSHNAIAVKQSDIKEIYDYIIKLYPYADETLKAKTRHIRSLQPQTIFLSYPKNKYDRRVKIVTSKFFDLTQFKGKVDTQLYVINTSDKKYANNHYVNEIKKLEELYPQKTPYELDFVDNNNSNQKKTNEEKKDGNKNEKQVKKDENKNPKDKFYEDMINYLNQNLNEKIKYKEDLLEIKDKLMQLSNQYEKVENQIEELINNLNYAIKNNITIYENNNEKSSNHALIIVVLIIILVCFIIYLYKKGEFKVDSNNINYIGINRFGSIDNQKELNLIDSKLI